MKHTAVNADLKGKVVVVTGGGRGIGRAIALAYGAAGAKVVVGARSHPEIEATAELIKQKGGQAIATVVDVSDYGAVEVMYARAEQVFGGVDIIVINAGGSLQRQTIEESDPLQWKGTIDVNLTGAFYTAHAAIPYLRRRGGGKMILIGSGLRARPAKSVSAYACSKAGLWALTQSLALELSDANISVNELIPGPVRTDLTGFGEKFVTGGQEWLKEPDEVVPLALFLATQPEPGPSAQSFSLMRRGS